MRKSSITSRFISLLLLLFLVACSQSKEDALTLQDLPVYNNATESQTLKQSSPLGIVGGELIQYKTDDTFDEVVDYYSNALSHYKTDLLSHTSELGRQTAISIPQSSGMISIAIQEFTDEGSVSITFMGVGH